MSSYEDRLPQKRQHAGAKKLAQRCHCGKIRAWHTSAEAKICKKEQKTETVVSQMTQEEVSKSHQMKI